MGKTSAKPTLFNRRSVEKLVDAGNQIVIFEGSVLKLDAWMKYHPGGEKAIMHMVGRDATDQINAFHSVETVKSMSKYRIGVVKGKWDNLVPPIQRASEGKNVCEINQVTLEDGEEITRVESGASSAASSIFESFGSRKRVGGSESPLSSVASSTRESPEPNLSENEGISRVSSREEKVDEVAEDAIVDSFRQLAARLQAEGYYDCNYWHYVTEMARVFSLGALCLVALSYKQYLLSSILMGTFWHQLVFIAHDAGHMGITHTVEIDTLLGLVLSSTLGGLSLSWWKSSHNVHHLACNEPSHDPDCQQLPFLAISPKFFGSLYSTYYQRIMDFDAFARRMVEHQHWIYYPLLCFGRFNLYFLSWQHVIMGYGHKNKSLWWHRPLEAIGQAIFWYWYGYKLLLFTLPSWKIRVMYVLVSHAMTMPLHVQFTLSHFAMGTETRDRNEPWARQQLRTTMDVDCPTWMDWFHGGLQFQAIHHLFPRLPRHNLRRTSEVVKVWAREVGVRYEVYGFVECNGRVLGRLEEVGRQAGFLREACAKVVREGEWKEGHWE